MMPMVCGVKPSSARNSFSTGTHRAMPPVNDAAISGASRRWTGLVNRARRTMTAS